MEELAALRLAVANWGRGCPCQATFRILEYIVCVCVCECVCVRACMFLCVCVRVFFVHVCVCFLCNGRVN